MPDIYRPSVNVGACTTLSEKSIALGGCSTMLRRHKERGSEGFPKPVARFRPAMLYVEEELDAFYKAMLWRYADRSVRELTGEMTHEAG